MPFLAWTPRLEEGIDDEERGGEGGGEDAIGFHLWGIRQENGVVSCAPFSTDSGSRRRSRKKALSCLWQTDVTVSEVVRKKLGKGRKEGNNENGGERKDIMQWQESFLSALAAPSVLFGFGRRMR